MAMVDYFLKLDGIPGEANDKTHKGEIEVESFSWGEHQTGTASAIAAQIICWLSTAAVMM